MWHISIKHETSFYFLFVSPLLVLFLASTEKLGLIYRTNLSHKSTLILNLFGNHISVPKELQNSKDIFTKSFIANITNITPSTLHSRVQFTTVQCRIAWRHYNNAPYYLQVAFCKSLGSSNNVVFYFDWQMRHKELQNYFYR